MTRRTALPPPLAAGAFTVRELRDAGLAWDRVRAADLSRVCRGVHTAGDPQPHGWDAAAAVARQTGGVLSHTTAAAWHGLPLPWRLQHSPLLHLTFDRGVRTHRTELDVVTSHRLRLRPAQIMETPEGLRATTPERTWFDLMTLLRPLEQDWSVAAGDHLVRWPWRDGHRVPPTSTLSALEEVVHTCRGRPGSRTARAALADVRVGSDSPSETFLRLALVRAGLPEPELQAAVDPGDPRSPEVDLGYRRARIALQYDGEGHRSPS